MLESDLNEDVRKAADAHRLFWQRFEDAVSPGIPDGYLSPGMLRPHERGTWLENKITATRGEKPVYRPGQLPWAYAAAQRGERCRTLVACPGPGGIGVWYRVFETEKVAIAEAFDQDWPVPDYEGASLTDALSAVIGCQLSIAVPTVQEVGKHYPNRLLGDRLERDHAEARASAARHERQWRYEHG